MLPGSRRLVGAGLALTLCVAMAPAAAATTIDSIAPAAGHLSPSSEASAASNDARALRKDVAALLQQYIDDYGDRFTSDEIAQLQGYRSTADRELTAVVLATNRVRYLTSNRATPTQVRTAVSRAALTWKRAKAAAETSWEDAGRIMEPRLSLFEKVRAANDYNDMMDRFDALGQQIRSVVPSPS